MRSFAFVPLLLGALSYAAPFDSDEQRACRSPGPCLHELQARKSAKCDCSSFLRKTVIPCPATTTRTQTVTVNGPSTTILRTTTQTLLTSQVVATSILDHVTTITIDKATTTTETDISKVTDTIFTTVTKTSSPNDKRNAERDNIAATTCQARTDTPSSLPTYASCCSGPADYSQACSCLGVTGSTKTAPRSTVTRTITTTKTGLATVTTSIRTVSTTVTVPFTKQTTSVQPTTLTTIDTTVLETIATTTHATTVVTQTTTVSAPTPSCQSSTVYNFVCSSGIFQGQYLLGQEPDPTTDDYGLIGYTDTASAATKYTINAAGQVYDQNTWGWTSENPSEPYFVFQMTNASEAYFSSSSANYMYCSLVQNGVAYAGSVGQLSCTYDGSAQNFFFCAGNGDYLVRGSPGSICNEITLAAIPVC